MPWPPRLCRRRIGRRLDEPHARDADSGVAALLDQSAVHHRLDTSDVDAEAHLSVPADGGGEEVEVVGAKEPTAAKTLGLAQFNLSACGPSDALTHGLRPRVELCARPACVPTYAPTCVPTCGPTLAAAFAAAQRVQLEAQLRLVRVVKRLWSRWREVQRVVVYLREPPLVAPPPVLYSDASTTKWAQLDDVPARALAVVPKTHQKPH